jgi:uncharacterized membrane protein
MLILFRCLVFACVGAGVYAFGCAVSCPDTVPIIVTLATILGGPAVHTGETAWRLAITTWVRWNARMRAVAAIPVPRTVQMPQLLPRYRRTAISPT